MKWISLLSAFVVALGMNAVAQADLFDLSLNCGAAKSCECASTCQPECCKPTITKPCEPNVYTYQRQCSSIKPPCCCEAAPACCKPAHKLRGWFKRRRCSDSGCAQDNCCTPAPKACCAPAPKACAAPAPKACCAPAPKACCAPAPKACAAPAPKACCAPAPKACCAPAPKTCAAPAADTCCNEEPCCNADPCVIAELIYQSQTACYAKHRRKAIHKLGDHFNCECNPEIMCAFIYALNDADERVRAKAADEIGDQLRKHCCGCSPELTAALTCALGDCDKKVVREATQALELCGYEVVEGCCDTPCCHTNGCAPAGCSPSAAPAAPAPASDPKAYFPSRLQNQKQTRRLSGNSLSNLFGLID
ncbi:hypothetical protein Pan161_10750 [Gimesia algae]|uniref:HEAT repeat protein n=1 Tax=Gimesia algae TaxID=2527971 RepID=A0A517V8V9_9PLAN|nr:hypothetical protein Pan161_10750 [Gimesia algae]